MIEKKVAREMPMHLRVHLASVGRSSFGHIQWQQNFAASIVQCALHNRTNETACMCQSTYFMMFSSAMDEGANL